MVISYLAYTPLAHRWQQVKKMWHGHAIAPSTSCTIQKHGKSGPWFRLRRKRLLGKNASLCVSLPPWAATQGWLAEHMLILGVESPEGKETLRRSSLPIGMRQNQFCDVDSSDQGWKVTTIATTLLGSNQVKMVACMRSTQKQVTSAWLWHEYRNQLNCMSS